MRNNLTKKEVSESNAFELSLRFNYLLEKGKKLPANELSIADAREIVWIEDEMRRKLIKLLGHDFYPPDRIEKEHPSNYMISLLKQNKPKPEAELGIKIKLKIVITSSIGNIVKTLNVRVDSRNEADLMACKMIRDLGLKKASYKIS